MRISSSVGFLVASLTTAGGLSGQACAGPAVPGNQAWLGWSTYVENDTFGRIWSSDRFYTHGMRHSAQRDAGSGWRDAEAVGCAISSKLWIARPDSTEVRTSFIFGSNVFTPDGINTFADDPFDRAYAGTGYVAINVATFPLPGPRTSGWFHLLESELHLGWTGALSGAGTFQTAFHTLRENRIPKGWDRQLALRPYVNLFVNRRWKRTTSETGWGIDFTPAVELAAGNLQTFAGVGGTVRLGKELAGFPGQTISLVRGFQPAVGFGVQAGVRGRAFAVNSLFDRAAPPPWTGGSMIQREDLVLDWHLGAFVGKDPFRLSYFFEVGRTKEFTAANGSEDGVKHYGSFLLTYNGLHGATWTGASGAVKDWLDRHLVLEVMVGAGRTSRSGLASQIGESMRFSAQIQASDSWAFGVDREGALREGSPPDPTGVHRDTFATAWAASAHFSPRARRGASAIRFRLAAGLGKFVTQETQDGVSQPAFGPQGPSLTLGVTAAARLGANSALLLDLARRQILVDPAVSTYSVSMGIRLH